MSHLEQQKAKARETLSNLPSWKTLPPAMQEWIFDTSDTLIEATHQAAIEECVREIKTMLGDSSLATDLITTLKADK